MFEHIVEDCTCPGKRCSCCKQVKCHGSFNRDKSRKDGMQVYCLTCKSAKNAKSRQNNPEHHRAYEQARGKTEDRREYQRAWHQNRPEYNKTYHKMYANKNHDRLEAYKEANRHRFRDWFRNYVRTHREQRAINEANRRTRKELMGGSFTAQQWRELKARYNYTCLCCGRQEPEIRLTADHVIPLSRGGSNDISNIQPLCLSCNSSKGARRITDYRN